MFFGFFDVALRLIASVKTCKFNSDKYVNIPVIRKRVSVSREVTWETRNRSGLR